MKRVTIAPSGVRFALGALTLIALTMTGIGAMLAAAANRVVAAQGGSATNYRISGVVIAALAFAALVWALRRWGAIRAFEIATDGWTAIDFLGRRRAIAAGDPVALELYGRRVVWTFGAAPRMQDVVDGTLVTASGRYRLAPSGPVTYDGVLSALGLGGPAPRRGRQRFARA